MVKSKGDAVRRYRAPIGATIDPLLLFDVDCTALDLNESRSRVIERMLRAHFETVAREGRCNCFDGYGPTPEQFREALLEMKNVSARLQQAAWEARYGDWHGDWLREEA